MAGALQAPLLPFLWMVIGEGISHFMNGYTGSIHLRIKTEKLVMHHKHLISTVCNWRFCALLKAEYEAKGHEDFPFILCFVGDVVLGVFLFCNFRHSVNGPSLHRGKAKSCLLLSELPASKTEWGASAMFLSLVIVLDRISSFLYSSSNPFKVHSACICKGRLNHASVTTKSGISLGTGVWLLFMSQVHSMWVRVPACCCYSRS